MRSFKRLSLIIILMLCSLFTFSFIKTVYAEGTIETSSELTISGASVRVSGKPGIRFVANVNNFDTTNVETFGMVIAFGRYEANDNLVIGATLDGSKVMQGYKKALNNDGKTYYVTVYNFPERLFLAGMTARAYVELKDGSIIYGEEVIYRSLGDVVLKAINSGSNKEGNLLEKVESIITSKESGTGYMKYGIDSFGNFTISNLYETDPTKLRDIFINDYNTFLDKLVQKGEIPSSNSIAIDSEFDEYFYSMTPRIVVREESTDSNGDPVYNFSTYKIPTNNENKDASTSPLYMFLNDTKYGEKWGWLLDYFYSFNQIHVNRQINAIRNGGTYTNPNDGTNYILYNLNHFIGTLWSFFNQPENYEETDNGWPGTILYKTKDDYANTYQFNDKVYADLTQYEVVKIGETLKLPDLTLGTEFNVGYNNGEYDVNDEIVIDNVGVALTPDYSEGYNIQFLDAEHNILGNLTYNGREDIIFDEYSKEGFTFEGWYESSDFTGEPVRGLSAGTKGDKTYYAKMYEGTKIVVNNNYATKTNGDVVTVNGVNYVVGTTAFATVLDAVNKANTLTSGTTLIEISAGTYTTPSPVIIANSNIKIVGPNYGVDASGARKEEAVLSNATIWINPNLTNIEFNGLKFTGNSKIFSRVISNNATYGTNTVGACINGFKFINNYCSVITTGWTAGTSGLIEFDHASGSYSYNIEITNNYFEHDLANLSSVSYEIEMLALDNVTNVNISNNTFKNIKDIAIHTYDKNRGLSGDTNRMNNNIFENIQGDAIRVNHFAPGNTGSNNIVEFDNNTFTDVTGTCISLGYLSGSTYYVGNSSDTYKRISISGNTFNSVSENYIYCYKWYNTWTNTFINDNVFNAIPSGYYIYVNYRTDALYPENTQYYNNGEELNINAIDSSKFTSNIKYAPMVEYGTRAHVIKPKNKKVLYWKGAAHPVKKVNHPGSRAKPYLIPAFEKEKDQFLEKLKEGIKW